MALLTVTQVADQLGTDSTHVDRLIARGRLKGTRLGATGPTRIVSDDLAAYVSAGAKDFKPATPIAKDWFGDVNGEAYVGGLLAGELRDALDAAVKDLAEPAARVERVAVAPTSAMRAAGRRPIPALLGEAPAIAQLRRDRYANFLELAAVQMLRAAARTVCIETNPKRPPLSVLYFDAAGYDAIVATAAAKVAATETRVRRAFAGRGAGIQNGRDVTYYVTFGSLIDGDATRYLRSLAVKAF